MRQTKLEKFQAQLDSFPIPYRSLKVATQKGKYKYLVTDGVTGEEMMRDSSLDSLAEKISWFFRA